jgi:hypothetical protein
MVVVWSNGHGEMKPVEKQALGETMENWNTNGEAVDLQNTTTLQENSRRRRRRHHRRR